MASNLTLPEELLLVALDDAKGSVNSKASTALVYALAGGQLLELGLAERLSLESKNVAVADPSPLGDELLDSALARMAAERKPHTLKWWVNKLSKKLKRAYVDRLVERGLVSIEKRKLLGLVPVTRHPETSPGPEQEIRARLRAAIVDGAEPDERTAALVALVWACSLDRVVLPDKTERKQAKARIKEITENQAVGKAVSAIVKEIEAAILIAVIAASAGGAASS
jgi:hypothetical protein